MIWERAFGVFLLPFPYLRGEANELCDLTVLGKVVKQLVACIKGYLVRLFAKEKKGFDCVIASCLGPYFLFFYKCK